MIDQSPCAEEGASDADARALIASLERELGVTGTAAVFRKVLDIAKEASRTGGYSGFSGAGVQTVIGSRSDIDIVQRWCHEAKTIPYLQDRIKAAEASASALRDRVAVLESALRSLEESLRPAELVPFVDPVHGAAVEALGHRIGFGAMMSSASASWAAILQATGTPGGEFVSGPCRSVLQADLRAARAALNGGSQ